MKKLSALLSICSMLIGTTLHADFQENSCSIPSTQTCYDPFDPCSPCAPACGTSCGLNWAPALFLAIPVAVAIIAGVASGDSDSSVHSHS